MNSEIKLIRASKAAILAGIPGTTIYNVAYRQKAQKFFVRQGKALFVPADMIDALADYYRKNKNKRQPSVSNAPDWAQNKAWVSKNATNTTNATPTRPAPLEPSEFGAAMRLIYAAMKRDDFKPAKFARVARVASELAANME